MGQFEASPLGRYKVFDGSYFEETYYLINKFGQKIVEFQASEYFEDNQLVDLSSFVQKLEANGFGAVTIYKNETKYNKKEGHFAVYWYLFLRDEQIIIKIDQDKVKDLAKIHFRLSYMIGIEAIEVEDFIQIMKLAESCVSEMEDDRVRYINIVNSNSKGLKMNRYQIKNPEVPDLDLYYGDGFSGKHQRFVEKVSEQNRSGLFIFHGLTGSGKTNYIRYLINQCKAELNFIFYPIALLRELTSPQIIPFISDYKNSVLILEESEDSVQTRDGTGSDKTSIANLLNISDGLLSDVLNLKIICTFNTNIKNLDKALLREGRLLGIHKFDKLPIDHANRIAALKKLDKNFEEPVTLAQIFNQPLNDDLSDFVNDEQKIGF